MMNIAHHLKTGLIALGLSLCFNNGAIAGNWHGVYVGGIVSYDKLNIETQGFNTLSDLTTDSILDSFSGDIYAGYNIPVGNLLFGIEGEMGYSGSSSSINRASGADLVSLDVKNNFSAGLRGRAGVLFNDFLLYGTAGVAYSNLSLDLSTRFSGTETTLNKKDNVMGYSVGGGAEFMVLNSLVLRAEYLYTDFDALDFSTLGDTGNYDSAQHDIRLGVALKF